MKYKSLLFNINYLQNKLIHTKRMSDKYEKQIYLAMLAEQCSRYEDMMAFLEDMVKAKTEDLSSDERNLLSIAYKNTISLDRQAIRTLLAYESKEAKKSRKSLSRLH